MSIKQTRKDVQLNFRVAEEITALMDRVAEAILRKTGVRPTKPQIFEAALRLFAEKHGCK